MGFPANALANIAGAMMISSRLRVCVAFWYQAVVLTVALLIQLLHQGNRPGLVSSMLALGGVLLWWMGVIRDHQKDDVAFLQKHIQLVKNIISKQQAAERVVTAWTISDEDEAWAHLQIEPYITLLKDMSQREKCLCGRFRMLLVE